MNQSYTVCTVYSENVNIPPCIMDSHLKALQVELSTLHPNKTVWREVSLAGGKTKIFVPLSGTERQNLKTEIDGKINRTQ